MKKILLQLSIALIFTSLLGAQTPTPTPAASNSSEVGIKDKLAGGDVKSIDAVAGKIQLATKDGAIEVQLSATTVFKKVSPDKPSLATAVDAAIGDIGEGDKILVTGVVAADRRSIPAKTVFLLTKSDIAKRNAAEKELWKTRGIFGRVASVDFKTQKVTLAVRGTTGETNVVLSAKENVEYLRYAPNSVKFSDVVESSLAELKVGDQLRALGDKSADGLSFLAEKVVSGSFKTVAGKVTAIDTATNEITIEDSQTKKPVIVILNSSTVMRKFPAEMAQMMAMAQAGGFGGARPPGGQPGATPGATRPPQGSDAGSPTGQKTTGTDAPTGAPGARPEGSGQRPGGGFGRRQGGDLDDMMERLPGLAIADLKVGDTIGISSTTVSGSNRLTAIKLIAGVEAFLTIPQNPAMGAGRGSQAPNINIPGLDGGFGNP